MNTTCEFLALSISQNHKFDIMWQALYRSLLLKRDACGFIFGLFHSHSPTTGAFACSGFSRRQWISVAKSAKLRKSMTEKRYPKKHISLSVAIHDRKHANRMPRPKVVVKANVKVTTKRLDYYVEITNRQQRR